MSDTDTLPTRSRGDGSAQVAMDDARMSRLLHRLHTNHAARKMYVKARGGVGTGTVGLYVELVNVTPGMESHGRYFIVGENVYLAVRDKGAAKANWRQRKAKSLEAALTFIDRTLARDGVSVFGRILLVELEADSVSQIESGQLPSARFRGQYRIEKDYGKYEFGGEIKTDEIPDIAVRFLTSV